MLNLLSLFKVLPGSGDGDDDDVVVEDVENVDVDDDYVMMLLM